MNPDVSLINPVTPDPITVEQHLAKRDSHGLSRVGFSNTVSLTQLQSVNSKNVTR